MRLLGVCLLTCGLLAGLPALADAEAVFYDGVAAYECNDFAAAAEWFRKAAEQGHAPAQYNLGTLYECGLGVPQDYVEAVKWFRKAAEQGLAEAQYNLGASYAKGLGVIKDYVRAYAWFNVCAAEGDPNAQEARQLLEGEMTKEQVAEAQKLSREIHERISAAGASRD